MKHLNLIVNPLNGVDDHNVATTSNDLWVLQPQSNPKYHFPVPIFNNLALFEATIHAA